MKTMSWMTLGAALLALVACQKQDGQTVGQKVDETIAQAKGAAEEAKQNAKRGMDEAAQVTKEKSEQLSKKTEELSQKAERVGQKVSDGTITAAVKADIAKDPDLSALRINVDTTDGKVSLSGKAPNEASKQRATQIAQNEKGVTSVDNQLAVQAR
jgi:hyperosmotically inducible protein